MSIKQSNTDLSGKQVEDIREEIINNEISEVNLENNDKPINEAIPTWTCLGCACTTSCK